MRAELCGHKLPWELVSGWGDGGGSESGGMVGLDWTYSLMSAAALVVEVVMGKMG